MTKWNMRSPEEKEQIILEYLEGKISTRTMAEKYGIIQSVYTKIL